MESIENRYPYPESYHSRINVQPEFFSYAIQLCWKLVLASVLVPVAVTHFCNLQPTLLCEIQQH